MDRLYAPWRDRYVQQVTQKTKTKECIFCAVFDLNESDQEKLILWKNESVAVLLNLYPYNGGHLLIVPCSHVEQLYQASKSERDLLMQVLSASIKILKDVLKCDGMNMGANFGSAAGAGMPEHLHLHVVPRFAGDTGFFTTVGNGKQISIDLEKTYNKLKPHFEKNFPG